jgi:hypothetical protein
MRALSLALVLPLSYIYLFYFTNAFFLSKKSYSPKWISGASKFDQVHFLCLNAIRSQVSNRIRNPSNSKTKLEKKDGSKYGLRPLTKKQLEAKEKREVKAPYVTRKMPRSERNPLDSICVGQKLQGRVIAVKR